MEEGRHTLESMVTNQKAHELLGKIRALPGKKMLTLSVLLEDDTSDFVFDITDHGVVGYHEDHEEQLTTLLEFGIQNSGGLIIRQFTPMTYECQAHDGKVLSFPYKLIYAIFLGNSEYFVLSKEETEDVCCTDSSTGHRLKKEDGVIYRSLGVPAARSISL
ncbi:MAG: hypothetical protein EOP10_23885 [Proteobacteria bacterium]|nr:MAG: hypothetical protein EOP10_23885 [Pseudomonadota bacterium]